MKISTKLICLSAVVAALIGCQGNTGSTVDSSNVNNSTTSSSGIDKKMNVIGNMAVNNFAAGNISVDNLGVLPVSTKSNSSYLMRINNHSKEKYTLDKVEVSNNLLTVNTKSCKDLAPGARCSIELFPHTAVSGDAVVKFTFKEDKINGKTKQLEELVRMSAKLHSQSGVSMQNGFTEIVTADGNYSLAMPLQLEQDYDNITALNGNLVCNGNNFKAGNSCTYLMDGHALADNTLVNTGLILTHNGITTNTAYSSLLVRTTLSANLIISPGVEVLVNNEDVQYVTVLNAGVGPAKITQIEYEDPLVAVTGDGACEDVLDNGKSCKIYFKANSNNLASGINSAKISLDFTDTNGQNLKTLETMVTLRYTATQPILSLQDNGQLVNKIAGGRYSGVFELRNTGGLYRISGVTLTGPRDGLTINQNNPNRCRNGVSLENGQTCSIEIMFNPSRNVNNQLIINIVGRTTSASTNFRFSPPVQYSALSASDIRVISLSKLDDMRILTSKSNLESGFVAKNEFKLTNTAPNDRSLRLDSFAFAGSSAGLTAENGQCTGILDENRPSCNGFVVFGPRETPTNGSESSRLTVRYTPEGSTARVSASSPDTFELEAHDAAAVIVTNVTIQRRPTFSNQADGTFNDAIDFLALKGDQHTLKLRYTFTNYGNQTAEKLSIMTSTLPYYVKVDPNSTTCAYFHQSGPATLPLEVGNSCYLDIELPRGDRFDMLPNLEFGDVNLGYVYNDNNNTRSNRHENITALKRTVQFSPQWVSTTSTPESVVINPDLSGWLAEIEVTDAEPNKLLGGAGASIYPVFVTAIGDGEVGTGSLSSAKVTSCKINTAGGTCTVRVELSSDKYSADEKLGYELQFSSEAGFLKDNSFNASKATIDLFPYKLAYFANNNGNGFHGDLATQAKDSIPGVYDFISGIDAADLICDHDVNKPSQSRVFFAALASSDPDSARGFCNSDDPLECVYEPSTTYYNTNRQKIFATNENGLPIGDSVIESGLILPDGNTLKNVWLGYSTEEAVLDNSTFTNNCDNWTSSNQNYSSVIAGFITPWLPETVSNTCNERHAIMCIEK